MNEEAKAIDAEFEEVNSGAEMEQLELHLSTDVGTIKYGDITNLPTYIHNYLKSLMPTIEGGIVPPKSVNNENVSAAKDVLAKLRSLDARLEEERKRIKRIWNEPYEKFEKEYGEKTGLLDAAITNLAKQVKDVETAAKAAEKDRIVLEIKKKAADMKKGYDTLLEQYPELWKKVWKDAYTNKTFSTTKMQNEYSQALLSIYSDIKTLEIMPNSDIALSAYYRSGSLSQALTEAQEFVERQKMDAQFKAEEEARKAAEAAAAAQTASRPAPAPTPAPTPVARPVPTASPNQPEPGDIVKVFKVWHKDPREFHDLIQYMKAHGFHAEIQK